MSTQQPNIVLILADDLGCGDLGAYGNDAVRTPRLDALAAEGVCLRHHYSGSPMCAPARAALLTGRYPHRTGAVDVVECRGLDRIALRETTVADHFQRAGCATGIVGKWHNGAVHPEYHPCRRGFDEFVGFRGGLVSSYWQWTLEFSGAYRRSDGRYLTDVFTDEAVGFIERHRRDPFLLYVPYNAPHSPLEAPEEDVRPFREAGRHTQAVATLYGMVRRLDQGVGRILDTLKRQGLAENTLVLFTSDNGPHFWGTGEADTRRYNGVLAGSKGSVLEGGIRVPAIIRWPAGLAGGRWCDEAVHFTDWLPTLAAAAGLPAPEGPPLDGVNALPLLRGEASTPARDRFWQWNRYDPVPECNAAVREGPWKLVFPEIPEAMAKVPEDNERTRFLVEHPEEATDTCRDPVVRTLSAPRPPILYNLDEDPGEETDVAAQHPARIAAMRRSLQRWFESVEAERLVVKG